MDKTNLVGIILGIIGTVSAYIFYLLNKNQTLKDKVGSLEGESSIREEIMKKDRAEEDANVEETKYNDLKSKYLKSKPGNDDTSH